jgi:6-phosphogluconate dehydrogenase
MARSNTDPASRSADGVLTAPLRGVLAAPGEGNDMELGMVGLGRMGGNMARRLMRGGHRCVVYDRDPAQASPLVEMGAQAADSLEDLVRKLSPRRAIWVMLPAGAITGEAVRALGQLLNPGDTVIDGGNTRYTDDLERSQWLARHGVEYVDCGTSGGIWGEERGYCLMIGGKREIFERLEPVFAALAPGEGSIPATPGRSGHDGTAELGYVYCGSAGSGHFVKMVHNGIEYGMMEALAEGFDLMKNAATFGYDLPVPDIAEVWRRGSVVSSWLLDLAATALAKSPDLAAFEGDVADSGEGRWTVDAAVQAGVPVPAIGSALFARFRSQEGHTFAEKMLSAMRLGFGGHVEPGQPARTGHGHP